MEFGQYRQRVRHIAYYTIFSWIVLATVIVVLMIWSAIDDPWLGNVIWSATAITVGILLGCITYIGFAIAEDESRQRTSAEVKGEMDGHLREAFEKAKITPPESE